MGSSKKPWASKTVWVNLIMAGLAFAPPIQALATPDIIAGAFTVVNLILRAVTKDKISIS